MAAPASSVIYSNGGTESVKLKEMIMLQEAERKKKNHKNQTVLVLHHIYILLSEQNKNDKNKNETTEVEKIPDREHKKRNRGLYVNMIG